MLSKYTTQYTRTEHLHKGERGAIPLLKVRCSSSFCRPCVHMWCMASTTSDTWFTSQQHSVILPFDWYQITQSDYRTKHFADSCYATSPLLNHPSGHAHWAVTGWRGVGPSSSRPIGIYTAELSLIHYWRPTNGNMIQITMLVRF